MNEEVLKLVETELLDWPGVGKEAGRFDSTVYKFGKREIGHIHTDGMADFPFPSEVRNGLIRAGKVVPHRIFPNNRTSASFHIRSAGDVPGAIELFRMNYERAKTAVR